MVPRGVASSMVSTPTCRDVTVARIHLVEAKYSSYQRIDHSLGGNSRYWEPDKDMGMTITVGATSSSMMMAART